MTDPRAAGTMAPGYEPVLAAARQAVVLQGGGGVQVAARHRGAWVVDVCAGSVTPTSLIHTWSAVKPVVGTALLVLVDRGACALDTPVRDVWPDLRAAADGRLTLAHVLGHGAGLTRLPPPGTAAGLADRDRAVAGLAAAEPEWAPGEAVGEHAFTYGHLVGELIRRLDGRTPGRFLADEVCGPLGLDLHVGCGPDELARCVDLGFPAAWWPTTQHRPGNAAVVPTDADPSFANGDAWRRAEVPAVNGQATARALAGFWAAHLDGALPAGLAEPAASGVDRVLGDAVTWARCGGMVVEHRGATEVGMGGLGGQYAGARAADDLAFAFLTTEMGAFDRFELVEDALYEACGIR